MTERKWQKGQVLQFLGCKHADGSDAPIGALDYIDNLKPGGVVKVYLVNPISSAEYPYTILPVDFNLSDLEEDDPYEEINVREIELGELNLGNIEDYM